MSFQTGTARLNGFIYTDDDFHLFRNIYQEMLAKYAPNWPNQSESVVEKYWKSDSSYDIAKLINIVDVFCALHHVVTPCSMSTLSKKFVQLINLRDDHKFNELMTELHVGQEFGSMAGPIWYEPLVPIEQINSVSPPTSPDFGIRLPDSLVLLEVTNLHIEALDRWARAINDLRPRVMNEARRNGLNYSVNMQVPLGVRADFISKNMINDLISKMKESNFGNYRMNVAKVIVQFDWNEIPLTVLEPTTNSDEVIKRMCDDIVAARALGLQSPSIFCAVRGDSHVSSCVSTEVHAIYGSDIIEIVTKSIRNTLDKKRRQLPDGYASVIILKSDLLMTTPELANLIRQRIFANNKYSWLAGIGLYKPRDDFRVSGMRSSTAFVLNENAIIVPSKSLVGFMGSGDLFWNGRAVKKGAF